MSRELTLEEEMALHDARLLLRSYYEYAVTQDWINKPLAWAIHQVWKEVNKEQKNEMC